MRRRRPLYAWTGLSNPVDFHRRTPLIKRALGPMLDRGPEQQIQPRGDSLARLMSRQLREELAQELGVAHLVQGDYWGEVPARQCGNLVRQAILRAERALAQQPPQPQAAPLQPRPNIF